MTAFIGRGRARIVTVLGGAVLAATAVAAVASAQPPQVTFPGPGAPLDTCTVVPPGVVVAPAVPMVPGVPIAPRVPSAPTVIAPAIPGPTAPQVTIDVPGDLPPSVCITTNPNEELFPPCPLSPPCPPSLLDRR